MRRIRIKLIARVALVAVLAGGPVAVEAARPAALAPALPDAVPARPAAGVFLVAARKLDDPHFGQSVVYLVEHDANGTLGLIVNRPSGADLAEAVPGIDDTTAVPHRLYYGGPVGLPMILMLLRSETAAEGMAHVADDVYISSDRRVLDTIIAAATPASMVHFFVGYSGWGAGQLEFELRRDDWHVIAADADTIFASDLDSLWDDLIESLDPPGIRVETPSQPVLAATQPVRSSR